MSPGDFYATLAALLWSGSVILLRVSGFKITAVPLTFFKSFVAILGFLIVLLCQGSELVPDLSRAEYGRLVLSAVLGITIADTMFVAALNRLGASLQALADCVYSPAMAGIGFLMFGEVLGPWEWAGAGLVISGLLVGMGMSAEVKHPRHLYEGMVLAAGAHIIMAVGILMVRDLLREISLVWVSGFRFFIATLVLGIIASFKIPARELFAAFGARETWRTTIPMAIMGPFLATLCWVAGFKYTLAGRAAIYNQLSTVFIIILASIFLRERMNGRRIVGVALAMAGAIVVARH